MNTEVYKTLREHMGEKPDSLAFARLAEMLFENGKKDTAFKIIEKGLEQNPSYITGYVLLGHLLHKSGQLDEARKAFQKVLEFDPFDLAALQDLVEIELSAGNYQAVAAHILQVLSIDPNNHIAYDTLVENWDKINEAVPELIREPEPELITVDMEKIGGGTFSLIGTEPIGEIKHLPLVVKTMPEELQALEQMTESKNMEPVELNEIDHNMSDLVEIDEIFKAFKAPVAQEIQSEQLQISDEIEPPISSEKTVEMQSKGNETDEIDLSFDNDIIVKETEQASQIEPSEEISISETESVESALSRPAVENEEMQDALDWGLENTEPEISQEIKTADEQIPQVEQSQEIEQTEEIPSEISDDIFEFDTSEPESEEADTESPEVTAGIEKPIELVEPITNEQVSEKKEIEISAEEFRIEIPQGNEESVEITEPAEEQIKREETIESKPLESETIESEMDIPENIFEVEEFVSTEEKIEEILENKKVDESIRVETKTDETSEIELSEDIFPIDNISEKSVESETVIEEKESGIHEKIQEMPDESESNTKVEEESEQEIENLLSDGKIFDIPESEKVDEISSFEEILKQPEIPSQQEGEIGSDALEIPQDIFPVEESEEKLQETHQKTESTNNDEPSGNSTEISATAIENESVDSENTFAKQSDESDIPQNIFDVEDVGVPKRDDEIVLKDAELLSLEDIVKEIESSGIGKSKPTEQVIGEKEQEKEPEIPADEQLQTEQPIGTDEIEIERIDGIQQHDNTAFTPPAETDKLSGLDSRVDFSPPDEKLEIDGLEMRIDNPFEEIPRDILEHLVENNEKVDSIPSISQKSSEPSKKLKTRTEAEIYAAQGKTKEAIEIYEQILANADISEQEKETFEKRLKILRDRLNKQK
ncbi:tetratricopeptide repeat protein [bacterium]|nr:tetratricopeptide repeat protein [bacterium]